MVWWFAAPLVIWGAKKIYDAATEDATPSYSSTSSSTLSSAKASRTKLRKKLIREVIFENRKHLISEVFNEKELESVKLDGSSSASAVLAALGFNSALDNLSDTIRLLNPAYINRKQDDSLLVFTDIHEEADSISIKANKEYGSMAGIDHCNEYDKLTDPFVAKLEVELLR